MADANSSARGAHTKPLTPSTTNSLGPPESEAGHHRLPGEERLERDIAEVLVERRINHRQRPGVQPDQVVVADAAKKRDAIGDAGIFRDALRVGALGTVTGDDQSDVRIDGSHRVDDEVDALDRFDAANGEHVITVRARPSALAQAAAGGTAARRGVH